MQKYVDLDDTSSRAEYKTKYLKPRSWRWWYHMDDHTYTPSYSLGTSRDRTAQFISWREKGKKFSSASVYNTQEQREYTERTSLLFNKDVERGDTDDGGQQDPVIFKLRQDIQQNMDTIRALMEEIRVLHGKASLNTFDDGREDEIAVEVATQQITSLFRSCENSLQKYSVAQQTSRKHTMEATIRENIKKNLALDLQKLSLEFRKQQKTMWLYLHKKII